MPGDYYLFALLDQVKQMAELVLRLEGADLAQSIFLELVDLAECGPNVNRSVGRELPHGRSCRQWQAGREHRTQPKCGKPQKLSTGI